MLVVWLSKVIQIPVGGFDSNFSYLVVGKNKKAILIDATGSSQIIDLVIRENDLNVVAQLSTHSHPDHIENVKYYESKGIMLKQFGVLSKQKIVRIAGLNIKVIPSPGHTKDSVCFLTGTNFFSGDTLFVKGVGNTQYGGNEKKLNKTLEMFFTLPKDLKLWPGHDYGGAFSTLGQALINSHRKPSEKTMKTIHKRVSKYGNKKS